ncbi:MAG: DUF3592 domain-containing protein [Acidobacteria bacterium]|nr:DUF3592 domain-containing protein [Acidobacteriota bacterium]
MIKYHKIIFGFLIQLLFILLVIVSCIISLRYISNKYDHPNFVYGQIDRIETRIKYRYSSNHNESHIVIRYSIDDSIYTINSYENDLLGYQVGDSVKVYFDKNDPTTSWIVNKSKYLKYSIIGTLGICMLLIGYCIYDFNYRTKYIQPSIRDWLKSHLNKDA